MRSIHSKFIIAISLIIIATLSLSGYLLSYQKASEIKIDIAEKAQSFAELTVAKIIDNYELYYKSQSFTFFKRELVNIFALNQDVSRIQIADYNGELLFDSAQEEEKQYFGPPRQIRDEELLERLQDIKPSIKTQNRILYLQKDSTTGSFSYVNKNEQPISELTSPEDIINIVYPYHDDQTRVLYGVSYENLQTRIYNTLQGIIIFLVIASVLGIAIAVVLARAIVRPIQKLRRGVAEIAKGNLAYQVEVKSKDEIKSLADGFNKMAKDLQVSTKAMIEKEKLSREIAIASSIQQNLLPKTPEVKGLDLAASVQPADEVGGDCYDFLKLDNDNTFIYIGDVTGHGIPAGLVVAIANALFFTMLEFYDNTRDIIIQTNKILKAKTEANMFITAALCNWNSKKNKFHFTSAGHEQIVHYHAKDKKITLCPAGGLALGMMPDISKFAQEQEIKLAEDDVLFLYSDGIPEAWTSKKEMLGMEGFQEIIAKVCADNQKTAQQIHDEILQKVQDFMGNYPQADDITLIVIKRK